MIFSEEELKIIEDNNLRRTVLLERTRPVDRSDGSIDDDVWNLEVFQFMKGKPNSYTLAIPAEAKAYEEDIKKALTQLKEYLTANTAIEEKSTSFEL